MKRIKLYLLSALASVVAWPSAFAQSGGCVTGDGVAQSIVYKVNGATVSSLAGNVKPSSKVQVTFKVAGSSKTRFSLVSYTAPSASFSYESAVDQRVYRSDSRELQPGSTYTLTVIVPDCYYQVDFVKGCVIEQFGPANTNNYYGRQNRLIAAANGGNHYCSGKDEDNGGGGTGGGTEGNTGPCTCDNDGDGKPDADNGTTNYNASKTLKAWFSADGKKVIVTSTDKDISNIVVKYDGAPDYKYDNLTGKSYTITSDVHTILGVWVKAGNNKSGDGPGYGEFIANLNSSENTSVCTCSNDSNATGGGSGGGGNTGGGTGGNHGHPKKVTICHIPPGNPGNAHTITISENAVDAHIKNHGDYYGECKKDTVSCKCDYDGDGKKDNEYGSTTTNADGDLKAAFNGPSNEVTVTSTNGDLISITVNYTDGTSELYDNLSGSSKTITTTKTISGVCVQREMGKDTKVDDKDKPGKKDKKVTICHIPPGNPDNAHTITISENAVDAHIKNHGDYYGACKECLEARHIVDRDSQCTCPTPPPVNDTCMCDYDNDGKNDKIYGSTFTSVDGTYAAKFNGKSDSVLVLSQTTTINTITFYFEDGSSAEITDANTQSQWYTYPGQVIMAVEINGNIIENLSQLDPDVMCDCMPDVPGEPVPVKMTKFEGKKIAPNVVYLEWETASEVNSDYIAIEKSVDINTWREVCRVPGHGTTNDPHQYNCTDNNAGEDGQNLVYYRPKQVDLNGAYEYFDMIRIRLQDAAYASKVDNVYPNPTTGMLYVTYNASENGLFKIRLLSIDGKVLMQSSFTAKTGNQTTDLNLAEKNLKPGLYVLEVQSENEVFRQKVYKQ